MHTPLDTSTDFVQNICNKKNIVKHSKKRKKSHAKRMQITENYIGKAPFEARIK